MRILISFTVAVLLALSSCSTTSHTADTNYVVSSMVSLTVADMNVKPERVEHTSNWNWRPFSTFSTEAEITKATGELLREQKADVLVEPQYVVNRRGLFRGGTVTVSGYPAIYHNFRPMTETEAATIATLEGRMNCGASVINTSSPLPFDKKPKKNFFKKWVDKAKGLFIKQ